MPQKKIPIEQILSRYIVDDVTGCWNYTGTPGAKYGLVTQYKNPEKAHRASYRLHVGDIPTGMYVCHRCDNPRCINPAHLFLGTPAENSNDMRQKGRSTAGENHRLAKLTEAQAIEILKSRHIPGREMAKRFNVSEATVSFIRSGKIWSHLS